MAKTMPDALISLPPPEPAQGGGGHRDAACSGLGRAERASDHTSAS